MPYKKISYKSLYCLARYFSKMESSEPYSNHHSLNPVLGEKGTRLGRRDSIPIQFRPRRTKRETPLDHKVDPDLSGVGWLFYSDLL